MKKGQANEIRNFVKNTLGDYTITFSSKSETLHIRIGTYVDRVKETEKEWILRKEEERENIIATLKNNFPQYTVEKNNKRYQGFINDICVTVK